MPTANQTLTIDGLAKLDGGRVYCRQCGVRLGVLHVTRRRPRFHSSWDAGSPRGRSRRRGALVSIGDIAVRVEETPGGHLAMDLDPQGSGEAGVTAALQRGEIVRTWPPGHFPLIHRGDGGHCKRIEVFAFGAFLTHAILATEAAERIEI